MEVADMRLILDFGGWFILAVVDLHGAVVAPGRRDRRGHGKNHEQCREKAQGSSKLPFWDNSGHLPSVDVGVAAGVIRSSWSAAGGHVTPKVLRRLGPRCPVSTETATRGLVACAETYWPSAGGAPSGRSRGAVRSRRRADGREATRPSRADSPPSASPGAGVAPPRSRSHRRRSRPGASR